MLPLEKEIGSRPLSSPRLWQGLQRAQNLNLHNRFPLTGSPYPAKADVLEMHFLLTSTLSASIRSVHCSMLIGRPIKKTKSSQNEQN